MEIQSVVGKGVFCKSRRDPRFRVLSIQTRSLGNLVYGEVLRRSFRDSERCELESYWVGEQRTLAARILYKVLYLRSPSKWINERNLDLWLVRAELAKGYEARLLVSRALRAKRYSVLHFHTQDLAFCSLDIMRHIPTVISTDMSIFQASPTRAPWVWPYVPNRRLERSVFRAAHTVVFFSEWARRSAVENHFFAPEKTMVIPPGIEIDRFSINRKRTERSPKRILFVGSNFIKKGGQELVDVFLERFKDEAELHLVTNAPVSFGHPHVHVHRQVEAYSKDWLSLYAEADIFVLPTRGEGFGLAIIEAMAAGLPVIATNICAIPEIVTHGNTGLLIRPLDRDALARSLGYLLNDQSLLHEMGARARKVAEEKFNSQRTFERLEAVFVQAATSDKK